jgi:GT2 family glycosyltransferase
LAVYRKTALDDVSYRNQNGEMEYFDELIHYKNDVDLAYRLQWAGHKCLFIAKAKVYHNRQVARSNQSWFNKLGSIINSRPNKSQWVKENSYFGHLVVLRKNFSSNYSQLIRFKTWLYNLAFLIFISIFEHSLLSQRDKIKKLEPKLKLKSKQIKRKVSYLEIEKLME